MVRPAGCAARVFKSVCCSVRALRHSAGWGRRVAYYGILRCALQRVGCCCAISVVQSLLFNFCCAVLVVVSCNLDRLVVQFFLCNLCCAIFAVQSLLLFCAIFAVLLCFIRRFANFKTNTLF